jgi:hypothetical protein
MGEWFLSSGFAWGLIGVSAPIVIHLLSRRRYRRVQWAAMEFLRRAMKKTQRRMRIENLILLALRTLALLLLVLALMRPVLAPLPLLSQLGEEERTVVIAIDESASMGARGDGTAPFDRARALALEILDNLKARDEVYLLWVGDAPNPVFEGPTPEKRRARQEIEAAQPSDSGTRWAPALAHLAEVLARPEVKARARRLVYCISDLQKSGWTGGGTGPAGGVDEGLAELARLSDEVVVLDVATPDRANVAVTDLVLADRVVSITRPTRVTAQLKNFGDSEVVDLPVAILMNGNKFETKRISLGAGETGTVDFFPNFTKSGAYRCSVEIDPDALDRDNRRDLAVNVRDRVRVLLVDGYPEAPDDYDREAFHLRLALYPAEEIGMGNVPSVIQPKETDASLLASVKLDDYDCIILANDAEAVVEPAMRAKIATYVREGGALLLIPGERVSSAVEDYNKALHFDAPGAKEEEADQRLLPAPLAVLRDVEGEPLRLQPQGWTHPIFREFNDARWREFLTDPSVERYLPVSGATLEGARVLATLNDAAESPAIIERSLGAGRIMLFAFGWSPSWGKLYAQPGGLILLHETVLYLARDPAPARTVRLGMPLRWVLDASDYADNVRVILPNGARKSIDPPKPLGDRFVVRVSETQATGFHQIELVPDGADPGADSPSALFAVVGDPSEGDLHPVSSDALLAGIPAKEKARVRVAEGVQSGGGVATTGSQREVSRPLLYLLLLVLIAESLLARRLGRRGT